MLLFSIILLEETMIRRFGRKFENFNSERENEKEILDLFVRTCLKLDQDKDFVQVREWNGRDSYIRQAYALKTGDTLIHLEHDGDKIIIREASIEVPPRKYVIRSERDMDKWLDDWGI